MTGSKRQLAIVIASFPAILVASSPFSLRCRSFTSRLRQHLPQRIITTDDDETAIRKPWFILHHRGGATDEINTTTTTSNTTINNETQPHTYPASKPGDGSESDPDGIPHRFLRMQKQNRPKARAAFAETLQWRLTHSIDTILSRPHTKFDLCRAVFPVYIPGRDVHGNLIIVQRPGMFDVDVLGRNKDVVSTEDVLMHYIYVVEYCWNILDPGPPDRTMTVILDLEEVRWTTFRDREKRSFMLKFVKTMSDHYPQRSFKTLVINAPTWFDMVYKIVKPLLRESTKEKISIVKRGPQQDTTLVEVLGIDSVPREILYDENHVGDRVDGAVEPGMSSAIEQELRLFCLERINNSNETMVVPV